MVVFGSFRNKTALGGVSRGQCTMLELLNYVDDFVVTINITRIVSKHQKQFLIFKIVRKYRPLAISIMRSFHKLVVPFWKAVHEGVIYIQLSIVVEQMYNSYLTSIQSKVLERVT